VIDYQTTSFAIAKLLSRTMCTQVIGRWIVREYWSMMEEVKVKNFSRMDASHHIFAGMKAMITNQV